MIERRRIVITGGAGFIGSHLCRRLCDRNEVVLFDSLARDAVSATGLLEHANVRLVRGDVRNVAEVADLVSGADTVVHLAAIAGVATVLGKPTETMTVNMLGTYAVLSAAVRQPRPPHVIDFSTSEVFGPHAYQVDEASSTVQGAISEARWTYAVSKLAGEHLCHAYHREFGLPVTGIRPFNIYGPGQVGEGAIHNFVVAALKDEDLVVTGTGAQIRAWCYVDDIVDATLACMETPAAVGQTFNIGNPRSTLTIWDLAERIVQSAGARSQIVRRAAEGVDVGIRVPSIEKAQTLLGYEPRIDLSEGLRRTIAWYRTAMRTARAG